MSKPKTFIRPRERAAAWTEGSKIPPYATLQNFALIANSELGTALVRRSLERIAGLPLVKLPGDRRLYVPVKAGLRLLEDRFRNGVRSERQAPRASATTDRASA